MRVDQGPRRSDHHEINFRYGSKATTSRDKPEQATGSPGNPGNPGKPGKPGKPGTWCQESLASRCPQLQHVPPSGPLINRRPSPSSAPAALLPLSQAMRPANPLGLPRHADGCVRLEVTPSHASAILEIRNRNSGSTNAGLASASRSHG